MKMIKVAGVMVLCMVGTMLACRERYKKNATHQEVANASIERGEALAKVYCASCHQLPQPLLLSAEKWEKGVLPQMGPRLGIFNYGFASYPSAVRNPDVGSNFYPAHPVLGFADWQNIIDYYTSLAPDSLSPSRGDVAITTTNQLFSSDPPHRYFSYPQPMTGCIYADTTGGNSLLFVADTQKKNIVLTDKNTNPLDSLTCESAVVDMALTGDTLFTTQIGVLTPNDGKTGSIQQVMVRNGRFASQPVRLADSLRRPVHMDVADLNKDGRKDILVCEFGNLKGALSWLESKGSNRYERHVLLAQPGAIATVVKDDNKDGLPDMYVLFAQGNEQIVHFTNKGNGQFVQKQVLQFLPAYGSSYFEMHDFNHDGLDDILYTCGDNADYSEELKPYHGVYIFLNTGNGTFAQHYFFHINGCFKAVARDFDGDGDADIAAISFFADYEARPEEGFVYLQNKGDNVFTPYSLPAGEQGRWLCMAVTENGKNNRPDIVLGNFSAPAFKQAAVNWRQQPAITVLRNTMRGAKPSNAAAATQKDSITPFF